MSYTIIGIDGKEYGPVQDEELRRWIAEGRLNGQSLAKGEGDTEFHPLAQFPEFAETLAPTPTPLPAAMLGPPSPAQVLARDYNLLIGDCINGGWTVVKNNFWPAVGVTLLLMVITGVVNQIVGLVTRPTVNQIKYTHHATPGQIALIAVITIVMAPLQTVLTAGLIVYFLKLRRGQAASVGDIFAGFGPSFGQLLLLGWVQVLLIGLGMILCIIPGLYLMVAWMFAMVLVIDREMGFWEAMEFSRRVVSKHWFVLFGFLIVYLLVVLAGVLGCCIGIFVTAPIGFAALVCAYEYIFSRTQN